MMGNIALAIGLVVVARFFTDRWSVALATFILSIGAMYFLFRSPDINKYVAVTFALFLASEWLRAVRKNAPQQ